MTSPGLDLWELPVGAPLHCTEYLCPGPFIGVAKETTQVHFLFPVLLMSPLRDPTSLL
jgi:hypothetical protein